MSAGIKGEETNTHGWRAQTEWLRTIGAQAMLEDKW
jgi:hypothetical protein